jgi:hypothetical protein
MVKMVLKVLDGYHHFHLMLLRVQQLVVRLTLKEIQAEIILNHQERIQALWE